MQHPLRERFLRANGLQHHVLEWGDEHAQEVVVLCHGFLDLAWGFARLAPRLASAGYRAIAIDFRGHGETDRTPEGSYYYFPDYVLDLHALLPQLVTTRFHLVGHSMGGTASAYFASAHQKELASLSLLEGLGPRGEPPARAPARLKSWLDTALVAGRAQARLRDLDDALARLGARHRDVDPAFLRLLAEKSTCAHPDGTGLTWRFDPLHRTLSPFVFDPERFLHSLAEIATPTLLVYGERGIRSGEEDTRAARIATHERAVVAGAGHMVQWTHDEEVARLLLAHFAAHPATT